MSRRSVALAAACYAAAAFVRPAAAFVRPTAHPPRAATARVVAPDVVDALRVAPDVVDALRVAPSVVAPSVVDALPTLAAAAVPLDYGALARKAVGGGASGAAAGVVQVCSLMWLRTAMNYQRVRRADASLRRIAATPLLRRE